MKTAQTRPSAQLTVVGLLAPLLERLEHQPLPGGAAQYRSVVSHLREELLALQSHPGLSAVLDAYPATAELYENLQYEHAGLCRSPLEHGLNAEMEARRVIAGAARPLPSDRHA